MCEVRAVIVSLREAEDSQKPQILAKHRCELRELYINFNKGKEVKYGGDV